MGDGGQNLLKPTLEDRYKFYDVQAKAMELCEISYNLSGDNWFSMFIKFDVTMATTCLQTFLQNLR